MFEALSRRRRPPVVDPIVVLQQPRSADRPHETVAQPGSGPGKVVARAVARRRSLHPARAASPHRAIDSKRAGGIVWRPREALGRHGGVLDRHGGALCQVRQHRMRGVAEKRHRTLRPAPDGPAVIEGPLQPRFGEADERTRGRRPRFGGKARYNLGTACRFAPAGSVPAIPGDDHDVDNAAGLDRIMHQMSVAPEPKTDLWFAEFRRDLARRNETPPGGAPGEAWRRV